MRKETGGSAFPNEFRAEGMTLRDYVAAKAMQSLIVGASAPPEHLGELYKMVSKLSYLMADAMIAERNK